MKCAVFIGLLEGVSQSPGFIYTIPYTKLTATESPIHISRLCWAACWAACCTNVMPCCICLLKASMLCCIACCAACCTAASPASTCLSMAATPFCCWSAAPPARTSSPAVTSPCPAAAPAARPPCPPPPAYRWPPAAGRPRPLSYFHTGMKCPKIPQDAIRARDHEAMGKVYRDSRYIRAAQRSGGLVSSLS